MEILTLSVPWSFILIELELIVRREIVWPVERHDFADLSKLSRNPRVRVSISIQETIKIGGKGYFYLHNRVSVKLSIVGGCSLAS